MSLTANQFGANLFGDLVTRNVLDVTEDNYADALAGFIAEENRQLQLMTDQLADRGTDSQSGFANITGGTLQKVGIYGPGEATRSGGKWFVGYPIDMYGDRAIYDVPFLRGVTFGTLAESILNYTLKDIATVRTELFKAALQKTNYTFDDSVFPGNLTTSYTVYRLANADSSAGVAYAGGKDVPLGSLNHYRTTGNANFTLAAAKVIRTLLGNVGNNDQIVIVASRATCDYVADNFGSDFIEPVSVRNAQYVDPVGKYSLISQPQSRGRIRGVGEIVEWPDFPDTHVFGFDPTKPKPLRIREHPDAVYRGFNLSNDLALPSMDSHPLVNKTWRRIFGVGVRNRTNGVAMEITTDGTYDDPTF